MRGEHYGNSCSTTLQIKIGGYDTPMENNLKINRIDLYKADIELLEPFRTSLAEITTAYNIFVRIHTDQGIYGTGESRPNPPVTGESQATALACGRDMAKRLLHQNPLDIETRMTDLNGLMGKNSATKSAFDIALYDLLGKAAGLPLYAVLGGPKRTVRTDNTVSLGDPDHMAETARTYKEQGFTAIKIKLGTGRAEDLSRVHKIRAAVGPDIALRLDVNQGWDLTTAIQTLSAMDPLNIEYCEQPLAHWDWANIRRVRERTSIPIMADETLFDHHDAFKLAAMGCCDYFNIKLAKSGGIHTGLKINAIGEAAGIFCMAGCMTETRLCLTAAAHMVSARPNIRFADLDGHLNMAVDPVIGGALYNAGEITLPDTPGHGADIDPDFLNHCTCETIK